MNRLPMVFFAIMVILMVIRNCDASTNFIMSDYDFTNRNAYSYTQLKKEFAKDYTEKEIRYAWEVFVMKGLNPLLFYLIAHKEGMPKDNYHLGCGIHLNMTWYKSFGPQVWAGATTLRKWFDKADEYGCRAVIMERHGFVFMKSKATFSLYKYTPHWKVYLRHTKQHHGNYIVGRMWEKLKSRMEVTE